MCLLLYKPKGKTVSTEEMKKAWERNSDGATLMWIDESEKKDKWRVKKGILDKEEFLSKSYLWEDEDISLVAHLRWASSGTGKGVDLCHGFDFTNKSLETGHRYLFHNGNLRFIQPNMKSSDTHIAADKILQVMTNKEAENFLNKMAEKTYGKFIIFYHTGPVILDNKTGIWEDGVYFSNKEHTKEKKKYYNGMMPSGINFENCGWSPD